MCGIAGVMNFNGPVDEARLISMRDMITHRGPDDSGLWMDEHIGLAHRRLSIIDLSPAGHQPFFSANKNLVMLYNGELYNYIELKTELEQLGYLFKTHSDTEVLLTYFQHAGPMAMEKFNGMFAIAIWNREKRELFVARDRVGVKPLYYCLSNNDFVFASEPKAMIKYGVPAALNERGFDELLAFRFIAGPNTIFSNINKLLPGHYATITLDGKIKHERWWHLGEKIAAHSTIQNPFEWFSDTFTSSVKYRMVSDVQVGVLLSAGLDSTSVTKALKNNRFDNIETFNVAFKNRQYDESVLAERFCEDLDYRFNKIYVEKDELANYVEDASYHYDEPLVHMNDPQILAISKFAKSKVSVLLSGEGADEFLGGYIRYKTFQHKRWWPLINSAMGAVNLVTSNPRLKKLKSYLDINNVGLMQLMNSSNIFMNDWVEKYKLYGINFFPEYRLKILQEAKSVYPGNYLRQLLYLDQHTYLQSLNDRNDRATMGASIECREPFMDYRLMEGIGTLKDDFLFRGEKNKYLLANTIGKTLPEYIRKFKKVGFSVPWHTYIKTEEYFRHHLFNLEHCDIFKAGIFNKLDIKKLREEFLTHNQHNPLITQLVFICIWYESYFKRIGIPSP
ncbi:MAG: asparagine synthase (glutamine-hydrolyzing) [Ginsengibacter sp.]